MIMSRRVQNIIMGVVALVAYGMIIGGQKHVGYAGLAVELIGLIVLVALLFIYNSRYK